MFFGMVVYLESKKLSERLSGRLNGKSKKIGRITSDNHNLSEVIVVKKEGHKAPLFKRTAGRLRGRLQIQL